VAASLPWVMGAKSNTENRIQTNVLRTGEASEASPAPEAFVRTE
jgi:hypothetical protein